MYIKFPFTFTLLVFIIDSFRLVRHIDLHYFGFEDKTESTQNNISKRLHYICKRPENRRNECVRHAIFSSTVSYASPFDTLYKVVFSSINTSLEYTKNCCLHTVKKEMLCTRNTRK